MSVDTAVDPPTNLIDSDRILLSQSLRDDDLLVINNDENTASNNNVEMGSTESHSKSGDKFAAQSMMNETCKSRKRKRFLSQQQQRKNNKNWKINKFKRQQSEKPDNNMDLIKFHYNNYDKNGRKLNFAMIKFNKNNLGRGRQRSFPLSSKFFLPEKRPCKNLIIPPTKFLLGGNISDPLNLNSLQSGDPLLNDATPKSSPITTPPKIEVIIPPNIHDPLHLLDPVDAMEYQKQLTSPVKKRKKTKHRNRNKKKKNDSMETSSNVETDTSVSTKDESSFNESSTMTTENIDDAEGGGGVSGEIDQQKPASTTSSGEEASKIVAPSTSSFNDREKILRELKLDLPESGRKRRISESHQNGKAKVRRMDAMDKIVSPVIPQPGAWKRLPRAIPSGAPRGGVRNRTRTVSSSKDDNDNSPVEEGKKDIVVPTIPEELESEICNMPAEPRVAATTPSGGGKAEPKVFPETSSSSAFDGKNARYQYGNYDRYYGYRSLNEFMDVRLKVFTRFPHLFRDKDVLDIGCNAGHITIAVAKILGAKTVTGIDIDRNLIDKARRNLSLYVKIPKESESHGKSDMEQKEGGGDDGGGTSKTCKGKMRRQQRGPKGGGGQHHQDEFFPISFPKCYGIVPEMVDDDVEASSDDSLKFPKNVFFKASNYVLRDETILSLDTQQYDLIMCLSVTKWIHLNFGDGGLKLAFRRMFNQLRPGGKLILEAQNWASYKKKKKLTEKIFENYKAIEFYPNKFHEYLLGPDVGFSHSYALGIPRHLGKGFRRPIQLYIKGDFTPSQIRWSDTYQSQTPYTPYRGIYAEPIIQPRGSVLPNKTVWGNETPYGGNGNYSYRFTPSQNLSATSQYYNPYETDTYLPSISYNMDVQKRQYCFASPLYSAVWSPPASGRNSASHTPAYGSVREGDSGENNTKSKHVYTPTEDFNVGKLSNRSTDNEVDKSPKVHVYANTETDSIPSTSSSAVNENKIEENSESSTSDKNPEA